MFLTVRQAAALLRATERQVYRWVDEGEIPFRRVRDQLRFNRTDLLEWATSKKLAVSLDAFDAGLDPDDRAPSFAAALRLGGVHDAVQATTREEALRAAIDRTPMPPSVDRELLIEILVAREATGSTAIGDGIAIPHVRHPVVAAGAAPAVSLCRLATPVPFGAPDGQPVGTLFLIVSPTVRTHLQMLAHLARALRDVGFRTALDQRAGLDELFAEATRLEAAAPEPTPPAAGEAD